jgi:CheY-like chemotaxis protein
MRSSEDTEKIRILAVDDDPDVLVFFRNSAMQIGIECDTALGSLEALSLIAKNGSYSMYFVDWDMPDINGIEFTRTINEDGDKNTVIIMASVTDWDTIHESAQEAGITQFISKPLFMTALADCVKEYLGVTEKIEDKTQNESIIDLEGHSILLVEDVDINREIVLSLLEPTNLAIDCAENGAIAVQMFFENPTYEMIFMDLQMPEMDGYTATRNIRASDIEWAKDIPIVAMTANVFKEDVEKCLAAGMNDHIGKPLDFNEVIGMLKKHVKKT